MIHPQRYNRTNFVSNTVAAKIIEAMDAAMTDGLQHYVTNKHEQRWLRVCIKPVEGSAGQFTYEFLAGNGQDVGHLILQAMFVWPAHLERAFSQLSAELYTKAEHPYKTFRQVVIKELEDAAEDARREAEAVKRREYLKRIGATHSFRTPGGVTFLGRYVRNWLGVKGFLAMAYKDGARLPHGPFKLSREAFLYGTTQGLTA